jgi:hypothetical protein
MYTSQASPDDDLSGSEHVSSGIIRLFYVAVTFAFLFVNLPHNASPGTVPLTDATVPDISTRETAPTFHSTAL